MWKSVTGGGSSSGGNSGDRVSAVAASELSSVGLLPQDSPLLGLLSAVSRPAVSFLQRWSPYLPGRHQLKQDLVEPERELLKQLDDILPPQQLHSLPWINLSELGIHPQESNESMHTQTVLGHVLLPPRAVSQTWFTGLWSGVEEECIRATGAKPATAFIHKDTMDRTLLLPGAPHLSPALIHCLGLSGDMLASAPDLDNGYSSLEEEQLLMKAQLRRAEEERQEVEEAELVVEQEVDQQEEVEEDVPVLQCNNKAIAFIMGCPCSDDSSSSDDDDDDEEDDDGFDSDGSSDISDSDSDSVEEEVDSEVERLWSALCQNQDPYNPRNFTAKLGCSAPRPIPRGGAELCQVQSSPREGADPVQVQSSPGSSCSSVASSSSSSSWDEASEAEGESENMKLLSSFSCSDPYSPLNFQATIRTRPKHGPKAEEHKAGDPKLDCRPSKRQEEERVRKISESSHCSSKATSKKQVRFQAEVQVFSVGCEERRGHWEELARDRARFTKRCGETEELLRAFLQPEHRERVYMKICCYYGPKESI